MFVCVVWGRREDEPDKDGDRGEQKGRIKQGKGNKLREGKINMEEQRT